MGREKQDIDNYFAEGLGDLKIVPPPDVWANIQNKLDKKKRAAMVRFWTGLAAGLALLFGVGSFYFSNSSNPDTGRPKAIASDIAVPHGGQAEKATAEGKTATSSGTIPDKIENSEANQGSSIQNEIASNTAQKSSQAKKVTAHEKAITSSRAISGELKKGEANQGSSNLQSNSSHVSDNQQYTAAKAPFNHEPLLIPFSISDSAGSVRGNAMAAFKRNDNQPEVAKLQPLGVYLKMNQGSVLLQPKGAIANTVPPPVLNPNDYLLPVQSDAIQESPKENRWSVSGQLSPLYSYRNASQSDRAPQEGEANNEKALLAYSGGLKVGFKTNRRLSFQAGVYYAVMGQTMGNIQVVSHSSTNQNFTYESITNSSVSTTNSLGPITILADKTVVSSTERYSANFYDSNNGKLVSPLQATVPNTQEGEILQELKFIEIPLLARYLLIDRKIGCHLVGGLSSNILVNSNAYLKVGKIKENLGKTEELNVFNYGTIFGLGLNYQMFKKLDFMIEPTCKYYINSISTNSKKDYHPYSFGIFTGITYKF